MKKHKFISFALLAVISLSVTGCSDNKNGSVSNSSAESSMNFAENLKSDGIADNEISVAINEEADVNQTVFKLNRIIDSRSEERRVGKECL